MWRLSSHDITSGGQQKVVASGDFAGPAKKETRRVTDVVFIYVFMGAWALSAVFLFFPLSSSATRPIRLERGTEYSGRVCGWGGEANHKYLYPIMKNGPGRCVDRCPHTETSAEVSYGDPTHKRKMICKDSNDFDDFTTSSYRGTFSALTPIQVIPPNVNAGQIGVGCPNIELRNLVPCASIVLSVVLG